MDQDHKIGLALAILFIGGITAFFFRRELPSDALLTDSLDYGANVAQVELGDVRVGNQTSGDLSGVDEPLQIVDQGLPSVVIKSGWNNNSQHLETLHSADHRLDSKVGGNLSDQVEPTSLDKSPRSSSETERQHLTHVVRRGESLSSLAARYLGSAQRYREIFECNRDRLQDVHAVREGMELRIPVRAGSKDTGDDREATSSLAESAKDPEFDVIPELPEITVPERQSPRASSPESAANSLQFVPVGPRKSMRGSSSP